jgi:hypothetical protein
MKLFVSEADSPACRAFADRLELALSERGHTATRRNVHDRRQDPPEVALADADGIVVIMGEMSASVLFEVGYAVGAGKPVILVRENGGDVPAELAYLPLVRIDPAVLDKSTADVLRWVSLVEGAIPAKARRPDIHEAVKLYQQDPAAFERLRPEDFEAALLDLFKNLAAEVVVPSRSKDGGIDILLHQFEGHPLVLVEVKKFSSSNRVPLDHVAKLLQAVEYANGNRGILVSASGFTASAREFARRVGGRIELWDMPEVIRRSTMGLAAPEPAV